LAASRVGVSIEPSHYLRQAMETTNAAREQLEQFRSAVSPNGEDVDPRVGEARRALDKTHQALHVLYVSRTTLS